MRYQTRKLWDLSEFNENVKSRKVQVPKPAWCENIKNGALAHPYPELGFFPGTQMMIFAPTWVSDPGFWVSNVQIKN